MCGSPGVAGGRANARIDAQASDETALAIATSLHEQLRRRGLLGARPKPKKTDVRADEKTDVRAAEEEDRRARPKPKQVDEDRLAIAEERLAAMHEQSLALEEHVRTLLSTRAAEEAQLPAADGALESLRAALELRSEEARQAVEVLKGEAIAREVQLLDSLGRAEGAEAELAERLRGFAEERAASRSEMDAFQLERHMVEVDLSRTRAELRGRAEQALLLKEELRLMQERRPVTHKEAQKRRAAENEHLRASMRKSTGREQPKPYPLLARYELGSRLAFQMGASSERGVLAALADNPLGAKPEAGGGGSFFSRLNSWSSCCSAEPRRAPEAKLVA